MHINMFRFALFSYFWYRAFGLDLTEERASTREGSDGSRFERNEKNM